MDAIVFDKARAYPAQPYRDLKTGLRANDDGGTILETALVLPVFFLLLFGFFSFSIALFGYCNATFAARAAVRFASVSSTASLAPCSSTTVNTLATSYLFAAPASAITVATTWNPANTVGSTVTVSIQINYPIGAPMLSLTQVTVGSTAQRLITR